MKNQLKNTKTKQIVIHSISTTKNGIGKIGIIGLKNLIVMEAIMKKIIKSQIPEKYEIKKIMQLNFLNKKIGRIYSLFIFEGSDGKQIKTFFSNLEIHLFTTNNDFSKNIDSRDFVFLKQQTIYEKCS